ncbi:hypothetical protein HNQ91_003955 [Filimonas zeae]|uniref:Tail fiber protein n=1 Tax=Filimonas zeae TaxID=1737353 RepID=A0A917J4N3_9BACT|nr:hypothetical protein [Filimonas zeae]MDR6340882.1 hypothetical protein [Filimonas zeae]GGH78082.1 hypothetical protein GCM10011379_45420 [Filimonas zeae]
MARELGSFSFSGNFEVAKKGALDARTYCPSYADLLAFTAANFIYNGHVVSVWDTDPARRGLYRCINENALSNPASWQKVGDDVDLSEVEKLTNRNIANGYAGLDASGLLPSSILPSYVDDVIERASLAAMPATGETGKIYVTLDSNKTYRWSGSTYIEISASPGSTDAIPEGSLNLYHTAARVAATPLTGLAAGTGTPVASDTVLTGFGKVLGFINNIAATIRGTALTGFSATTGAVTASDTVLSAPGKLQGQVTALQGNIPTTAEMQAGTDNAKFATASRVATWWAWVKTQAQVFTARVSAPVVKLVPQGTTPASSDGDIWMENTNSRPRMQKGGQVVDVLTSADNYLFVGASPRLVQTNALGDLSATQEIAEGFVTDTDVISAITSASFNAANNYTANVSPLNSKTLYQGQWYKNGADMYFAVDDNSVYKFGSGNSAGSSKQPATLFQAFDEITTSGTAITTAYSYTLPANTLAENGNVLEYDFVVSCGFGPSDRIVYLSIGGWGPIGVMNATSPSAVTRFQGSIIRISESKVRVISCYTGSYISGAGCYEYDAFDFTVDNPVGLVLESKDASSYVKALGLRLIYKPE